MRIPDLEYENQHWTPQSQRLVLETAQIYRQSAWVFNPLLTQ
jgi:hypothetical protein